MAREAKAATERFAGDMATFRQAQAEQGAALSALTGAQTQMLVSMAEIKTDLGWIRNDLVRQVSDARGRAEDAASDAKEAADKATAAQKAAEDAHKLAAPAPKAGRDAFYAQALAIIALLASLLAGILGIAVPRAGGG